MKPSIFLQNEPTMPLNFWQRLKNMFQQPLADSEAEAACPEDKEELLLHEVLQRSPAEIEEAMTWAKSPQATKMLAWLDEQNQYYIKHNRSQDTHIDFLRIPSVQGFVVHFDPIRWDSQHFQYFFDYLKATALTFGYWQQLADVRTVRRGGHIHSTQRYYLKPPRNFEVTTEPAAQLFGNIMVCMCFDNQRLVNIKFSATHYNDRLYAPPLDFAQLMQRLVGK
jgi:hypothetical protein